jgi:tetratricopeptide (TPR) repeat protein
LASARGVEVMGGTTGPAVYVYRGEAHRRLGQLERARADLERAIELTPTRVGAWVNLALVHDARGDPEAFAEVWTHLERTASGLLSSAAAALGVTLFRDPGDEPTQAERRAVLEQALRLMRGNRSTSCATFFSPDGRLRFVQPFSAQQVAPHARDEEVLARVERALRLGVAVSPPASRSRR